MTIRRNDGRPHRTPPKALGPDSEESAAPRNPASTTGGATAAATGIPRLTGVAGSGTRLPGAWMALIFVCLAFTPSLVPRPGIVPGGGVRSDRGDRLRPRRAGGQGVAGVRGPAGSGAQALVVAGVRDRRRGGAADVLPAGAAVAGPDPRPDERRTGEPRLQAGAPGGGGAGLRWPGRRRPGGPVAVPVGRTAARTVDGAPGRARAGVGVGRRTGCRAGSAGCWWTGSSASPTASSRCGTPPPATTRCNRRRRCGRAARSR